MAKSIDDALDDIAAARADLEQYRTLCFRLVATSVAGSVATLAGSWFANSAVGVIAISIGTATFAVAVICLIIRVSSAYSTHYSSDTVGHRHPAKRLREAELQYQRILRREV